MWGVFTNTGYNDMPTSLGIVWMLINFIRRGSVADKPRSSRCPSVSEADCIDMLFFMQQQVLITSKRNYLKNISDNPSQMGFISSKPSVSGFLDVCVSLAATNGRQM